MIQKDKSDKAKDFTQKVSPNQKGKETKTAHEKNILGLEKTIEEFYKYFEEEQKNKVKSKT